MNSGILMDLAMKNFYHMFLFEQRHLRHADVDAKQKYYVILTSSLKNKSNSKDLIDLATKYPDSYL